MKKMKKSRRSRVRIISFFIAAAAALFVWGAVNAANAARLRRQSEAAAERALTQLGAYMSEISTGLDKTLYVSSDSMSALLSDDVWRAAAAAKLSLSEITDNETELSSIYKFLSQAGEYMRALNVRTQNGTGLTEKQTEELRRLREYAKALDSELQYLTELRQSGILDFEKVKSTLSEESADGSFYFADELYDTEQTAGDYPTLIYDGPFSDSAYNRKPQLLESLAEITKAQALKRAADFIGVSENELYFLSECEGDISCFTFYNAGCTVSVTKKGGIVSYMLCPDFAAESELNSTQAVKKAAEFLKSKGYKNIKDSYFSTADGICTVNFAYYEDGIIYYPDLIKVSVALDSGKITAFDASGYIMNHKNRTQNDNKKYTHDEAQKLLAPGLTVKGVREAYIPTDYGSEYYVYEYHCSASDGEEVLVYIDPYTGEERDILILLYSDGGVLTK